MMKYVLVKYKELKLLINEGLDSTSLLANIHEIEDLAREVSSFYENLLGSSKEEAREIETKKQELVSKIGYKIIGVPFSNHDAELYALDKQLDYEVLEIHGNTGNSYAKREEKLDSQLQIRLSKRTKSAFVKQAQRESMKLSEWVLTKLISVLDKDLKD